MTLKQRIQDDMKTAMRAKDSARLGAVRLLMAAIKQREVDERIELDDVQVLSVVEKLCKQRRESISQFEAAGRDDLVAVERFELDVLNAYLPEALSAEALEAMLETVIAELGASSIKDMGRVMTRLREAAQGRADMSTLSARVKARLSP